MIANSIEASSQNNIINGAVALSKPHMQFYGGILARCADYIVGRDDYIVGSDDVI